MSIDPKTGKIIQDRVKDKINYQTSFTDFKIFYLYCKTFQKFGMLKENEINSILGRERKKIGSWDNDNDSHARITLLQYKLIGKISDDNYALTKIGKAFLSLFDTNGKITDNETSIYNVCFDMLVAWHQNNDDFDIHPGLLLLKLLLQPELHYYITDHDLACIFNNQNNKKDIQYNDIVRQIVEFRDSGRIYTKSELKKTYTILTGYANNWGIFSLLPRSNGTIKYVSLKDDFKKIAISRLNLLSEDRILSDEEFSGLVQNEINLSMAISHFESKYGKEGMMLCCEAADTETGEMKLRPIASSYLAQLSEENYGETWLSSGLTLEKGENIFYVNGGEQTLPYRMMMTLTFQEPDNVEKIVMYPPSV